MNASKHNKFLEFLVSGERLIPTKIFFFISFYALPNHSSFSFLPKTDFSLGSNVCMFVEISASFYVNAWYWALIGFVQWNVEGKTRIWSMLFAVIAKASRLKIYTGLWSRNLGNNYPVCFSYSFSLDFYQRCTNYRLSRNRAFYCCFSPMDSFRSLVRFSTFPPAVCD